MMTLVALVEIFWIHRCDLKAGLVFREFQEFSRGLVPGFLQMPALHELYSDHDFGVCILKSIELGCIPLQNELHEFRSDHLSVCILEQIQLGCFPLRDTNFVSKCTGIWQNNLVGTSSPHDPTNLSFSPDVIFCTKIGDFFKL